MRELSIDNFKKEVGVNFRGEQFLVRDNGAVCRMQGPNNEKRRLDGVWTLGRQCKTSGYRRISGLLVHHIVATAFYGEQPSRAHVVDHLDTNRRNNRIENLRWVTRLENLASNPKTLRRIEQKWGSIEKMLQDPKRAEKADPLSNRSWMPQKAEDHINDRPDTDSYSPLAIQRNWKTPSAFPLCPGEITVQPLKDYLEQLSEGSIFSHNKYGESEVEMAALSEDGCILSVITRINSGIKGWGLAKITFEGGKFVHAAHGTFFTAEGAEKNHCEQIGKKWDRSETFDDFC